MILGFCRDFLNFLQKYSKPESNSMCDTFNVPRVKCDFDFFQHELYENFNAAL